MRRLFLWRCLWLVKDGLYEMEALHHICFGFECEMIFFSTGINSTRVLAELVWSWEVVTFNWERKNTFLNSIFIAFFSIHLVCILTINSFVCFGDIVSWLQFSLSWNFLVVWNKIVWSRWHEFLRTRFFLWVYLIFCRVGWFALNDRVIVVVSII